MGNTWRRGCRLEGLALVAVAAAFMSFFAESVRAQAVSEQAGDWSVSCSDRLYCVAEVTGYAPDGSTMRFKLERGNKPNARIFVTSAPGPELKRGMRVDIDVLGLDEPYGVFGEVKRIYPGNEMTFAGPARRQLLEKLRQGRQGRVTVAFGGSVGTIAYDISLSGVTTALLIIDRAQGRLDRADAAVAWGGEPADGPGIAVSGEVVTGADPVAAALPAGGGEWANHIYSISGLPDPVARHGFDVMNCNLTVALEAFGAMAYGSGGKTLYLVPCHQGDVNIASYVSMMRDADSLNAKLYEFERPPGVNAPLRSDIINPNWDAATGRLTSIEYYSPEADCGLFEIHQYVEEGDFFEIIESREKANCDSVMTLPESYPLAWTIDEMGQ